MLESIEQVHHPEGIRATLGGSPIAFEEIVRRHQGAVRMMVSKWIQCPAAVDDIAQDVFVAAYNSLDRFDDQRSLESWLIGIAKNKVRLHLRSEARRRNHEANLLERQVHAWKAQQLEGELFADTNDHAALKACLNRLAPESRRLVETHYFRGRSLESIATESNRTGGSLRMMLMRIRKALAKCIRGQLQ
ncbi:MAG: sigma-70 family RNA polymerase sigma factor [Planctomycetota bacterium]